jgi:hypothetical protein
MHRFSIEEREMAGKERMECGMRPALSVVQGRFRNVECNDKEEYRAKAESGEKWISSAEK